MSVCTFLPFTDPRAVNKAALYLQTRGLSERNLCSIVYLGLSTHHKTELHFSVPLSLLFSVPSASSALAAAAASDIGTKAKDGSTDFQIGVMDKTPKLRSIPVESLRSKWPLQQQQQQCLKIPKHIKAAGISKYWALFCFRLAAVGRLPQILQVVDLFGSKNVLFLCWNLHSHPLLATLDIKCWQWRPQHACMLCVWEVNQSINQFTLFHPWRAAQDLSAQSIFVFQELLTICQHRPV